MLRDSLTGLPNRLGIHRGGREGGRERRPRPRACGAGRRHAALLPHQRIDGRLAGDELLITFARRLILGASRRRCPGADRRQRVRGPGLASPRRRGCAEGCRADPAGDGDAVQAVRAGDPRRMRDRRRADARRPGCRRSCSATPSSRSSRRRRPGGRRSTSRSRRPRRGAASRSRPSFAARSTRTSSSYSTSP